jgi:hypothetical protein
MVESGSLSPELSDFVARQWQDQFGLIEIG